MNINDKIKSLNDIRKLEHLSVKELAERLEISESLCGKLLYGGKNFSSEVLKKIKTQFSYVDMNIFFNKQLHQ